MVVKTQERRSGHTGAMGLHVGTINVQQYFPREVESIELELDHLQIVCALDPSFWQDLPEIHDPRLSLWLESKRNSGKLSGQGTSMTMIPSGESSFKLALETDPAQRDKADYALTSPPPPAYFTPTFAPSFAAGDIPERGTELEEIPARIPLPSLAETAGGGKAATRSAPKA